MPAKTLGEAVATDLAVKAVLWGPSIAGAILLGPVGVLLGAAVSVAIAASGGDNSPQQSSGDQGTK
ncbi:MAG TPA: hypothetical protein VMV10_06715 [Pirellulales bacterium]|nr:hypothetical protein [Pirellulales bacterium]